MLRKNIICFWHVLDCIGESIVSASSLPIGSCLQSRHGQAGCQPEAPCEKAYGEEVAHTNLQQSLAGQQPHRAHQERRHPQSFQLWLLQGGAVEQCCQRCWLAGIGGIDHVFAGCQQEWPVQLHRSQRGCERMQQPIPSFVRQGRWAGWVASRILVAEGSRTAR